MEIAKSYVKSPIGLLEIVGSEEGIHEVTFLEEEQVNGDLKELSMADNNHVSVCMQQLEEYFDGTRKWFSVPLAPRGTEFQLRVWHSLHEIEFGETRSYMEQTKTLGNEKAIRAVASANGKNPIAILIPCHRVVGSDGSLTGYGGGLWRKKWLLEHENPPTQTSLF